MALRYVQGEDDIIEMMSHTYPGAKCRKRRTVVGPDSSIPVDRRRINTSELEAVPCCTCMIPRARTWVLESSKGAHISTLIERRRGRLRCLRELQEAKYSEQGQAVGQGEGIADGGLTRTDLEGDGIHLVDSFVCWRDNLRGLRVDFGRRPRDR
jgi:hypothetical protein